MTSLEDLIPDVEVLLQLDPSELAELVLQVVKHDRHQRHLVNFCARFRSGHSKYPHERSDQVVRALAEAWGWLGTAGLLIDDPTQSIGSGWKQLSRRAEALQTSEDFRTFRRSIDFPRGLLNRRIAELCWGNFLRGDYETAIFQAFKEVEIAVRTAIGASDTDYGVDLMRKAFHEEKGKLTDMTLPISERQAASHFFAGAIGAYKNPTSHRSIFLSDPSAAAEMLMLASHLLRTVVDNSRKAGIAETVIADWA